MKATGRMTASVKWGAERMGGLSLIWLSKCKENWWSSLVRELKEAEVIHSRSQPNFIPIFILKIKLVDWCPIIIVIIFLFNFLGNSYGQKLLQANQALLLFS